LPDEAEEIAMHDLVIRGATVVDGLGHEPLKADVAVAGGRIAEIGVVDKDAAEVVDAGGLTLMPGSSTCTRITTHRSPGTRPCRPRRRSASRQRSWVIAASASCRRRRRCAI
jgi:formylmethanofuran dehydrogenase subunit A